MSDRSAIINALRDENRFVPAIKRLGGGRIARRKDGTLFALSGGDAIVVRLDRPTGQAIALRMLFSEEATAASLQVHASFATDPVIGRLRSRTPAPIAGGVSVIPDGILLSGVAGLRPAPVIAMEWLGDLNLAESVKRMVEANDIVRLSTVGTQWQRLMIALGEEQFTHGDLTPENAMLRRGDAVALIDYDTAAWPGGPRHSPGNRHPAYRHPTGLAPFVIERRDDFAALTILVSLRALALDPQLLLSSELPENGLVFTAADLADPANSERFRRIARFDDSETVALGAILAEACRVSADQTPPFEEAVRAARSVVGRIRRGANDARIPAPPVVEETGTRRLGPQERQARLTRLNSMLLRGNDKEAVAYWTSSGLSEDERARASTGPLVQAAKDRLAGPVKPVEQPPPPEPEPTPAERRRAGWKVLSTGASMARIEAALKANDHDAIMREWPAVADAPEAARYVGLVHQHASEYWASAIKAAARRGNAEAVLQAVGQADAAGVAIPAPLRAIVREAQRRVYGEPSDAADPVSGWAADHPELAHAIDHDDDRVIVAVISESGRADWSDLPDPARARVQMATRRAAWAGEVRRALRNRQSSRLNELLQQPVPGGERLLSPTERARILRIRERREAQRDVNKALAEGNDRAFVQAMRRLEHSSAPLPIDLDKQAFDAALERITRVTALRRALGSENEPDPRTVARLVPAAVMGGVEWDVIERLVNMEDVDRELVRLGRLARIREVIAEGDPDAIVAAALPDTHDVLRELTPEERAIVNLAQQNAHPLPGARRPSLSEG